MNGAGRSWASSGSRVPATCQLWREPGDIYNPKHAQYVSEVSIYSCLDSFVCFATLCCSISVLQTCFKIIIHFAAHMLGAPDVAFVTKHIGASVVHSWLPGVLWGMLGGFRLPIDSVSTPLPHLPFYLWLHLP